jgi:hypothetical protein
LLGERARIDTEAVNELGAPVASSIPEQLPGTSPRQQGRDAKMLSFCGIDVSKDRLDVMVLPEEQCCSVPNDAGGWAALVERLRNFSTASKT